MKLIFAISIQSLCPSTDCMKDNICFNYLFSFSISVCNKEFNMQQKLEIQQKISGLWAYKLRKLSLNLCLVSCHCAAVFVVCVIVPHFKVKSCEPYNDNPSSKIRYRVRINSIIFPFLPAVWNMGIKNSNIEGNLQIGFGWEVAHTEIVFYQRARWHFYSTLFK